MSSSRTGAATLGAQRGNADRPSSPDVADPVRIGHANVRQEDLVEMGSAVSLAERAHLDAGRPHVADEER